MAQTDLPRILCVDDEPNMLSALKRQMRKEFNISTATSPVDALEIIRKEDSFDVIISDYQMPGMNGAEFLSKAKEIDPAATRILLTGQASIEGVQSAINEGQVYKVLLKPWSPEELHEAVYGGVEQRMDKASTNEQFDELMKSLVP